MKTEPHEGEGIIIGIFLSVDQRAQVRVLDGKDTYNIDLPAINATAEDRQKYYDHIQATHKLADEGTEASKAIANEFNKKIESLNLEFLGAPVKLETGEANDNFPSSDTVQ
jgi:predicted RNA-binding protein with RPS1 domain